jgi:hypothetical protein
MLKRTVSKLPLLAILATIALMFFSAAAFASDAVAPADASGVELAKMIFDAVMHSQWWAAAALGVIGLCGIARKYLPASWKEGTKGDIVGTALAFVLAFAGAIFTWAVAPGAVFTTGVLATAAKVGLGAIGGYTILHKVLGWLAGWKALPAWLTPILALVAKLIGSDAVAQQVEAKATAAGDAAVAAKPSQGVAGVIGAPVEVK